MKPPAFRAQEARELRRLAKADLAPRRRHHHPQRHPLLVLRRLVRHPHPLQRLEIHAQDRVAELRIRAPQDKSDIARDLQRQRDPHRHRPLRLRRPIPAQHRDEPLRGPEALRLVRQQLTVRGATALAVRPQTGRKQRLALEQGRIGRRLGPARLPQPRGPRRHHLRRPLRSDALLALRLHLPHPLLERRLLHPLHDRVTQRHGLTPTARRARAPPAPAAPRPAGTPPPTAPAPGTARCPASTPAPAKSSSPPSPSPPRSSPTPASPPHAAPPPAHSWPPSVRTASVSPAATRPGPRCATAPPPSAEHR